MTTFAGSREAIPAPSSSPEDGRVLTLGVEALGSLLDVAEEEVEIAQEAVDEATAEHNAAMAELTVAARNVAVLRDRAAAMGENGFITATIS